jgi:hypothetical protein
VSQYEKLLFKLLSGQSDHTLAFTDLIKLLQNFGFEIRIKGSHHILYKSGVDEILNLQPEGSVAKPYQVQQVRQLIVKYHLASQGEKP